MRRASLASLGLAVSLAAATAHARPVEYLSEHPIPRKNGGGYCYLDVVHMHNYEPTDRRLFREIGGQFYFVGDPTPFHYEGPRYSYYGAHPVVDVEVHLPQPVYCYMKGPHYHVQQPPVEAQFQLSGGAYWYVGAFPQAFYDEQPRYVVVNDVYAPVRYARPVVDVHAAPVGFVGEISLGGPGFRATAVVGGPVQPMPPPPVQIGIGVSFGAGAQVGPHPAHHHHGHGGPRFFAPVSGPPRHGRPGSAFYNPRHDIARQPAPRTSPFRPTPVGRPVRGQDRRPPGRR